MSNKTKKIDTISGYKTKVSKEGYTMLGHSMWKTIKDVSITDGERMLLIEIITNTIGKSRIDIEYRPSHLAKDMIVTPRFIRRTINKLTDLNIISLVDVDCTKKIRINLDIDTWLMDVSPKDNEPIKDDVDFSDFE